jgi:hypothetical protein
VALFCSALACALALAYCLLRRGAAEVGWVVALQACGISLFLLHIPLVIGPLLRRGGRAAPCWYRSDALVSLLGLAAVGAAGWSASLVRFPFAHLFAAAGALLFLAGLPAWWRGRRVRAGLLVVAGTSFALCAAAFIWGANTHYPLVLEALSHNRLGIDVVYHAAIANMIKTHGVPSTGLEGPAYFHYAWASHWLIAQISRLLDQPVLDCYQLVFPAVFFPFMVQSLLHLALRVRELLGSGHAPGGLAGGSGWFWLLLFCGFWGFYPNAAVTAALDGSHLCHSVSYVVVVALACHLLRLVLDLGLAVKDRPTRLTVSEVLFVVLLLPGLMAVLTCCKVNGGFLMLGLLAYFFLRFRGYRSVPLCLGLAACAASTYLTYRAVRPPKVTPMRLFSYWNDRIAGDWGVLHFVLTWFWVLLYAGLRLASKGVAYLGDLKAAWKGKQVLDLEALAVLALLPLGPCAFVDMGTSEFYLLDFQHWIGLAFVLGGLPLFLTRLELRHPAGLPWHRTRLRWVAGLGVAVVLSWGLFWRFHDETRRLSENTFAARGASGSEVSQFKDLPWKKRLRIVGRVWGGRIPVVPGNGRGPDSGAFPYPVMSHLHQLERLPAGQKRQTALLLPYTLADYWGTARTVSRATLGPGLTGLAMINGLPEHPEPIHGYGQTSYDYTKTRRLSPAKDGEEILRRAASLGFSRVLVVDTLRDGTFCSCYLPDPPPPGCSPATSGGALVHGK